MPLLPSEEGVPRSLLDEQQPSLLELTQLVIDRFRSKKARKSTPEHIAIEIILELTALIDRFHG